MSTLRLLQHPFETTDRADWVRRFFAAGGVSVLLAQARSLRCHPAAMLAGGALLAGACLDWSRFFPRHARPEGTPSYRDDDIACCQCPADEVDEASMESFPASDPPAYHGFAR